MAIIENETDDIRHEHEETRSAPGGWNKPLLMAGLGLTLMLGGYAAINYVPLTPRQAEQERQLAELREMAAKGRQSGPEADTVDERLKQVAPSWRTPPFQIPGRLAIFGGLVLFVAAGVLMYQNAPSPKKETDKMA
ncbi:MAG TPA: hypothetical protein VH682_00455 [Gemmataceae bacterium]|jgi:hypothetical protein